MAMEITDYWFTIEPYVFIGLTNQSALLYNTLDRVVIESNKPQVIGLLHELLQIENCGVVLLTGKRYGEKEINDFVKELRDSYMGDIIDIRLSKGKPVQLLPYFNFPYKHEIYKKLNFSPLKNILEDLSEISIYVDETTNILKMSSFVQSIPGSPTFNIIGDMGSIKNYKELLSCFNQFTSLKVMTCSYDNVIKIDPVYYNNFSYKITVRFPVRIEQWNLAWQLLINQPLPVEFVFDVISNDECQQAEQFINQFQIEKYWLNPIYTGDNILFFEENIFLTKEDILSTSISIKDLFSRQAINVYDFGKLNILQNGDAYANLHYPLLGNIYTDNIYEIVQKEIDEGRSWFRIRNQAPCNDCVYQWLCPSPSNYEIYIDRYNLCHVCK